MAVRSEYLFKGKVTLQRVYLNRDGYTSGGCYFGVGDPLYYWHCEEITGEDELLMPEKDGYLRAKVGTMLSRRYAHFRACISVVSTTDAEIRVSSAGLYPNEPGCLRC